MAKWIFILVAVTFLTACSDSTEQAKETLLSRIPEKKYVEFDNLQEFPGNVVCGEYRSADPTRGGKRFQRFIVSGEWVENRPSAEDWQIFCSEDASAALFSTFGIGPLEDSATYLPQIQKDLMLFNSALAVYLTDTFSLPSTEQGLDALVTATAGPPLPLKFNPDGYLAAVPTDPWNRPYIYERDGLSGGVAQEYNIYTLGADGVVGGKGKDADVGTKHLKYLDLITRQDSE